MQSSEHFESTLCTTTEWRAATRAWEARARAFASVKYSYVVSCQIFGDQRRKRDAKGEIDRHIQRRRAEREADWKDAEEQHVHLVMQSDRAGRRVGCGSEGGE